MIYSCKGCEKRTPGCHAKCPEYLADKAKYDEMKAEYSKRCEVERGLYEQRGKKVYRAIKNRRKGKIYGG